MKPLSRNQKALLHVARTKLALSEDLYRSCLVQIAGVESCTELDQDGFNAVMGFLNTSALRRSSRAARCTATGPALPHRRRSS